MIRAVTSSEIVLKESSLVFTEIELSLEYEYKNKTSTGSSLSLCISSILQFKDLRVNQWIKLCIRINIRELNRELCTELSILYI